MKNHIKVKINVNGHDRVYGGWPDSFSLINIVSFLCDQVFLSLFVYLDQPAHCMRVRLVGLPLCDILLPFVTFSTSEYGSWLVMYASCASYFI